MMSVQRLVKTSELSALVCLLILFKIFFKIHAAITTKLTNCCDLV